MLIETVFLMIAALPQTTATPSNTSFCNQTWSSGQDGLGGFAQIETDKANRQVASRLTVWTQDLTVVWSGDPKKTNVSGSPASLTFNSLPLPKDIVFPVRVEVLVDGTSAGRFSFTEAGEQIVDLDKYREAQRLDQDALLVATRPGVQIPTIELDTLWGTAVLTVVATDRHGGRANVTALVLPKWEHVANFAETAFPAFEGKRVAGECRPVYRVVAIN